jgi:hypothetical protein
VVFSGDVTYVALANSWIIINSEAPPTTSRRSPWRRHGIPAGPAASSISGSRDIHAVYAEWSARGAQFRTPPKQHQHEIRGYIGDPDG